MALVLAANASAQRIVEIPLGNDAPDSVTTLQEVPDFDLDVLAGRIYKLVNLERRTRGLDELQPNRDLVTIAFNHSRDMGDSGFFDHRNLAGENATDRAHRASYVCLPDLEFPTRRPLGENLFTGYTYDSYRLIYEGGRVIAEFNWMSELELAEKVVEGWMNSPPHRANLLHDGYQSHGLGLYLTTAFELFVTQNMC